MPKKRSAPSKDRSGIQTQRPLKVNKDTLKDLAPQSRNMQQVKGGVPKIPE